MRYWIARLWPRLAAWRQVRCMVAASRWLDALE